MKLRSLLQRRQAARMPLLPSLDPDDAGGGGGFAPKRFASPRSTTGAREETLERLLTPGELEIVRQHRL
ncbi:hypothetical protein ACTD5D_04970 [Nocardia takedensis]|uniref:hypothetical protein n=1 Tax=Nocardia takedensis TaxID=259390 RepID=UPI0012F6DD79|nr:hypothetical protein [Nocardia takedensis]